MLLQATSATVGTSGTATRSSPDTLGHRHVGASSEQLLLPFQNLGRDWPVGLHALVAVLDIQGEPGEGLPPPHTPTTSPQHVIAGIVIRPVQDNTVTGGVVGAVRVHSPSTASSASAALNSLRSAPVPSTSGSSSLPRMRAVSPSQAVSQSMKAAMASSSSL